jgi:hypothetical protein
MEQRATEHVPFPLYTVWSLPEDEMLRKRGVNPAGAEK